MGDSSPNYKDRQKTVFVCGGLMVRWIEFELPRSRRSGVHASGGLTFEEAISLCEAFASLPLAGMDITLYDPNLDPDRIHAKRIIQLLRTIIG